MSDFIVFDPTESGEPETAVAILDDGTTDFVVIETGTPGQRGPIGDTGPANSLSIGTVTTGSPGSAADADITGTAPTQTLSLVIPRGDAGADGAPGAPGDPGEDGIPGATRYLVEDTGVYPDRPEPLDDPVTFVGVTDPTALMIVGDSWLDISPYTTVTIDGGSAAEPMFVFKPRRDTSAGWAAENPVLADGEEGIDITTGTRRIGNGVDTWDDLPPSSVTDHGALTGRGDDDHTQYALADGSRGDFAPAAHPADTTSVHGIADTADLILEGDARLTDDRSPLLDARASSTVLALVDNGVADSWMGTGSFSHIIEWVAPRDGFLTLRVPEVIGDTSGWVNTYVPGATWMDVNTFIFEGGDSPATPDGTWDAGYGSLFAYDEGEAWIQPFSGEFPVVSGETYWIAVVYWGTPALGGGSYSYDIKPILDGIAEFEYPNVVRGKDDGSVILAEPVRPTRANLYEGNQGTVRFVDPTLAIDPDPAPAGNSGSMLDAYSTKTLLQGKVSAASGIVTVNAGSDLTTARPTADVVYWMFSVGVDVGVDGANVVNGQPGDLYYIAGA